MSSHLIFKCSMSHGTMKYTLKAHVCYFLLMVELLHYLYSLHANFYTSENIINIQHVREIMGNFFNNKPKMLKLIVRVHVYHILIYSCTSRKKLLIWKLYFYDFFLNNCRSWKWTIGDNWSTLKKNSNLSNVTHIIT